MKKLLKRCCAVAMSALMAASVICVGAVGAAAIDKDSNAVLPSAVTANQKLGAVASGMNDIHIASAADSESYYQYIIKSDGTVQIMYFVGEDSVLEIPEELDGMAVTGIGPLAFCENQYLTKVVIPGTVKTIGEMAFADCANLTEVVFKEGIKEIGSSAFYMTGLESVKLPDSIEKMGSDVFDSTPWDNDLPDGMIYIGNVAYKYNGDMPADTTINIKDGTKVIAGGAFRECENLAEVTIPNSAKSIGSTAFMSCTSLKEITIPDSVKSMDEGVFWGCSSLSEVSIPNSIERMGAVVLLDTEWYNNQPDGVIYIGDICYGYKGSMPENTEITVKNGTRLIAGAAFANQVNVEKNIQNLKSVKLPNTVKVIDELAFYGASGLSSINIPGTVTTIGSMAFCSCGSLKTVTVPMTVTDIEDLAFGFGIDDREGALGVMDGFTLKGYTNTEAEHYCVSYGLSFTSLGTVKLTELKLSKSSMTMGVGEVYTISATAYPSYINQAMEWSSSDTSVAEVSQLGRITAKKTGTAYITVTKGDTKVSCKITVKKAPTSITLNATELTLEIGEIFDLNSSLPSGEGSYAVYYSSDNPSVASVKKSGGIVTAVAPGTANITAVTYNGKTVTCKVTVNEPKPELILGDVNLDGKVNLKDAIEIQKCALSLMSFDDNQKLCGDVDKNGAIKLLDSIYIQKYSLDMVTGIEGIGEKL
ncbi:MAG: leucine-rich repeat protein [Acutalibacteraceae bacterium]